MLPKAKRLTKKRDFLKLASKGHSVFGPFSTLRVRQTPGHMSKVAFITSTKVFKKAVDRNRAKRRMREVIRLNWSDIPAEMHLLFVLKPESRDAKWEDLTTEVKRMLTRIPEALAKPPKPSSRALKHKAKLSKAKVIKK